MHTFLVQGLRALICIKSKISYSLLYPQYHRVNEAKTHFLIIFSLTCLSLFPSSPLQYSGILNHLECEQLLWICFLRVKRLLDIAPLLSFVRPTHLAFVPFLLCASIPCCTYTLWAWILYQIQLELNGFFVVWDLEISIELLLGSFHIFLICVLFHFSLFLHPPTMFKVLPLLICSRWLAAFFFSSVSFFKSSSKTLSHFG